MMETVTSTQISVEKFLETTDSSVSEPSSEHSSPPKQTPVHQSKLMTPSQVRNLTTNVENTEEPSTNSSNNTNNHINTAEKNGTQDISISKNVEITTKIQENMVVKKGRIIYSIEELKSMSELPLSNVKPSSSLIPKEIQYDEEIMNQEKMERNLSSLAPNPSSSLRGKNRFRASPYTRPEKRDEETFGNTIESHTSDFTSSRGNKRVQLTRKPLPSSGPWHRNARGTQLTSSNTRETTTTTMLTGRMTRSEDIEKPIIDENSELTAEELDRKKKFEDFRKQFNNQAKLEKKKQEQMTESQTKSSTTIYGDNKLFGIPFLDDVVEDENDIFSTMEKSSSTKKSISGPRFSKFFSHPSEENHHVLVDDDFSAGNIIDFLDVDDTFSTSEQPTTISSPSSSPPPPPLSLPLQSTSQATNQHPYTYSSNQFPSPATSSTASYADAQNPILSLLNNSSREFIDHNSDIKYAPTELIPEAEQFEEDLLKSLQISGQQEQPKATEKQEKIHHTAPTSLNFTPDLFFKQAQMHQAQGMQNDIYGDTLTTVLHQQSSSTANPLEYLMMKSQNYNSISQPSIPDQFVNQFEQYKQYQQNQMQTQVETHHIPPLSNVYSEEQILAEHESQRKQLQQQQSQQKQNKRQEKQPNKGKPKKTLRPVQALVHGQKALNELQSKTKDSPKSKRSNEKM